MNVSTLRLAFIAPALLLIGASGTTSDAALKCGRQLQLPGQQPSAMRPLVILDGAFGTTDGDALLKKLNRDEILSIEIICVSPTDSTTRVPDGIPAMSITTKQGPASFLKPNLAAVLAAQDEHFRAHSTYSEDAANIALPFRSAKQRVSLDVQANGWIAKATFDEFAPACYVFDGSVAAPSEGLKPKQPECVAQR